MKILNGYRLMWILLMFDLPVTTVNKRKEATKFRVFLLDLGFEMAQLSVYMRYCSGKEEASGYIKKIRERMPTGGKVDIVCFTDKQYEQIVSFDSGSRKERKNPSQYALF